MVEIECPVDFTAQERHNSFSTVVQYNIKDPVAYLFQIKNIENTIRDVSESVMRTKIGDRSFLFPRSKYWPTSRGPSVRFWALEPDQLGIPQMFFYF